MKRTLMTLLLCLPALTLVPTPTLADEPPAAEASAAAPEAAATEAEYARMVEEAEQARAEAERARREASRVAERARETARMRETAEKERRAMREALTEEQERARAMRDEEVARAREELSRAHRELREAQRDVARAHRELSRSEAPLGFTFRTTNLGDRPVIGVVLGPSTANGVKLTGVSPDGPADEAGIQVGDVLVEINGKQLDKSDEARAAIFETMEAAKPGDTVELVVERDGERIKAAVVAELREPASWQSLVRIPEVSTVRRIEGGPDERRIVIESTVAPELDEEALAERMALLSERLEENALHLEDHSYFFTPGAEEFNHTIEFKEFSDVADHAFSTANVWFGLPKTQGLKLASVNEGLGAYFKTDHGVLVLEAKDDNAYQLEAGDVILKVGESDVKAPSDLVRALRNVEPGDELEIEIKRDRRSKTLKITVPENRFGLR